MAKRDDEVLLITAFMRLDKEARERLLSYLEDRFQIRRAVTPLVVAAAKPAPKLVKRGLVERGGGPVKGPKKAPKAARVARARKRTLMVVDGDATKTLPIADAARLVRRPVASLYSAIRLGKVKPKTQRLNGPDVLGRRNIKVVKVAEVMKWANP